MKNETEFLSRYNTTEKALLGLTAWTVMSTDVKSSNLDTERPAGEQHGCIMWDRVYGNVIPLISRVFPEELASYSRYFFTSTFRTQVIEEVFYTHNYTLFLEHADDLNVRKRHEARMALVVAPLQVIDFVMNDKEVDWKNDIFVTRNIS